MGDGDLVPYVTRLILLYWPFLNQGSCLNERSDGFFGVFKLQRVFLIREIVFAEIEALGLSLWVGLFGLDRLKRFFWCTQAQFNLINLGTLNILDL